MIYVLTESELDQIRECLERGCAAWSGMSVSGSRSKVHDLTAFLKNQG